MRILITGSRDWRDSYEIACAIDGYVTGRESVVVVHGGARGADSMAEHHAHMSDYLVERHPADWDQHGKRAGFVRNQHMVDLGADICLAFIRNNSRGATMCARLAEVRGIPVRYFRDDDGGLET